MPIWIGVLFLNLIFSNYNEYNSKNYHFHELKFN